MKNRHMGTGNSGKEKLKKGNSEMGTNILEMTKYEREYLNTDKYEKGKSENINSQQENSEQKKYMEDVNPEKEMLNNVSLISILMGQGQVWK